ncbi:hypothetical protein VN1261_11200 [Helicobacter pylori]|nr:hypothetical protein VN1261_11200 [Helicobacter pylori]
MGLSLLLAILTTLFDIDNKTKKLESCFRDAIKHPFYCPFTIGNYLILDNLKSCFIFQNDSSFNLKQYLLGLKEKLGFELTGIFYCENANTHKIELIGNDSDFREVLLEFSENIPKAPKIPQEKRIAKIKEQVNEEIKINPSFCNYRVDSEQNLKINEIVEGLKSGKIIGKKIISNAFDLNASYCFITPDGLKNLKERLFIDIINVINQKKRVALNHAQIDDIQYNVLDSAFYFIFDVGNPSHLAIIKVPRKSLENDELPNTKKNIFNGLIKTIYPLSDIITNAINQKERVALDYALSLIFIFDIDLHFNR